MMSVSCELRLSAQRVHEWMSECERAECANNQTAKRVSRRDLSCGRTTRATWARWGALWPLLVVAGGGDSSAAATVVAGGSVPRVLAFASVLVLLLHVHGGGAVVGDLCVRVCVVCAAVCCVLCGRLSWQEEVVCVYLSCEANKDVGVASSWWWCCCWRLVCVCAVCCVCCVCCVCVVWEIVLGRGSCVCLLEL